MSTTVAILSGSLYEASVFATSKQFSPLGYTWCNTVDKVRLLRQHDEVVFCRVGKWYEAAPQVIQEFDKANLQYNAEHGIKERG